MFRPQCTVWLLLLACASTHAATITVDSVLDDTVVDTACTLREALSAAANNAAVDGCAAGNGDDLITFDAALFSGTPPMATIALDGGLGPLQVTGNLPIDGIAIAPPPGSRVVLAGDGSAGLMRVSAFDQVVDISDLRFTGGSALEGGALRVGAVAELSLTRVEFFDNSASLSGGAVHVGNFGLGPMRLALADVLFQNNRATASASGGAMYVATDQPLSLTVSDSRFLSNQASAGGGAIRLLAQHASPSTGLQVEILRSVFAGNTAGTGGALRADTSSNDSTLLLSVTDSRLSGNSAQSGGAAWLRRLGDPAPFTVLFERTSILDNAASDPFGSGGGISSLGVDLALRNVLFDGNSSQRDAGALALHHGGADVDSAVELTATTFSDNLGGSSASAHTLLVEPPASASLSLSVTGSVFAEHQALASGDVDCALPATPQLVLTGDYNVAQRSECAIGTGSVLGDPLLELDSTSDPVHTRRRVPAYGGPAIDIWPEAACADATGAAVHEDLAGTARPANGDPYSPPRCDAGAFEAADAGAVELSFVGAGSGRVTSDPAGLDCADTCTGVFERGTDLVLTATAEPGSTFAGWDDWCSGTGECAMQLDGVYPVEVYFEPAPTHTLTVTRDGDGSGGVTSVPSGIACGNTCAGSFAQGTRVTLSAVAHAGSAFDGFSGAGCSTSPCEVELLQDVTVAASFAATHFPLEVALVGTGGGSVTSSPAGIECPGTCAHAFDRADTVQMAANPGPSSVFVGWEGACSGTADCQVDMANGAQQVSARFELVRELAVSVTGGVGGRIVSAPAGIDCPGQCMAQFAGGSTVVLAADPAPGTGITHWFGACSEAGSDCTLIMDGHLAAGANFAEEHTVQVVFSGTGSGRVTSDGFEIDCTADCQGTWLAGQTVHLQAAAAVGSWFAGWQGPCSGTGACTVTVDAATTVTAVFELLPTGTEVFANGFE